MIALRIWPARFIKCGNDGGAIGLDRASFGDNLAPKTLRQAAGRGYFDSHAQKALEFYLDASQIHERSFLGGIHQ